MSTLYKIFTTRYDTVAFFVHLSICVFMRFEESGVELEGRRVFGFLIRRDEGRKEGRGCFVDWLVDCR